MHQIKDKHSLLQDALAIARTGCWEWDLQSKVLTCSDEVYSLFGLYIPTYSRYEPFLELIQEKDRPLVIQAFRQALHDKKVSKIEFSIIRPDSKVCTLEARGGVREDANGKAAQLIGTLQDVTERKEAEKALMASQQQYHFIIEAVPAMVWTAYPEDNIDYINTWMVNYTGLPAQNLMGKGWMEILHPDDWEPMRTVQKNALQSGRAYRIELRFKRADGSYRWHIRQALPLKSDEGKITKWIGINTDIHEQKLKEEALQENQILREAQLKLEVEKEFSESILENSINGILAFDNQGQITKWNKHMEFLSGRKKEEVLGKSLIALFPEYVQGEEGDAIRRALQGENIILRRKNGLFGLKEAIYEINLMPLLIDGKRSGSLGFIFEVTEILKLEQEQTNLRLEGQKMVLNAILQAQEQERERISESLHNGVGQLLFAARLNLQLANSKPPGRETEAIFSKVNDLLNEAIRQSRSVSFELVPTILKDFGLQATLEDLAQRLSSPALTIHILVEGLEKRPEKFLELTIYRIIQALVGNVMEHSQAREATVQVSASGNEVVILVSDNGKGFNPATATSSHTEGDLQTVSNRVALLNGTLSIDSAPGKGTTVRVILPVSRPI